MVENGCMIGKVSIFFDIFLLLSILPLLFRSKPHKKFHFLLKMETSTFSPRINQTRQDEKMETKKRNRNCITKS